MANNSLQDAWKNAGGQNNPQDAQDLTPHAEPFAQIYDNHINTVTDNFSPEPNVTLTGNMTGGAVIVGTLTGAYGMLGGPGVAAVAAGGGGAIGAVSGALSYYSAPDEVVQSNRATMEDILPQLIKSEYELAIQNHAANNDITADELIEKITQSPEAHGELINSIVTQVNTELENTITENIDQAQVSKIDQNLTRGQFDNVTDSIKARLGEIQPELLEIQNQSEAAASAEQPTEELTL